MIITAQQLLDRMNIDVKKINESEIEKNINTFRNLAQREREQLKKEQERIAKQDTRLKEINQEIKSYENRIYFLKEEKKQLKDGTYVPTHSEEQAKEIDKIVGILEKELQNRKYNKGTK